jgi:hypothetical protein
MRGFVRRRVISVSADAKIPFAFNISRRDSLSMYSKVTFMLFASLFVRCPLRWVFGILIRPLIRLSLISNKILSDSSISPVASSIAFPRPTIAGTFSVPALRFLS